MSDDRDRRLHEGWMQNFARSLDQYDALARQHTHYVLCLDPADYPVHKRGAAWHEAGKEIRRIARKSKPLDPLGYFR